MDAREQLLLSEGVCRQLCIIHYHPSVKPHGKVSWSSNHCDSPSSSISEVRVPTVTINLVDSVKVLPGESSVAEVHLESYPGEGPVLLQQTEVTEKLGLFASEGIVQPRSDGKALISSHY